MLREYLEQGRATLDASAQLAAIERQIALVEDIRQCRIHGGASLRLIGEADKQLARLREQAATLQVQIDKEQEANHA